MFGEYINKKLEFILFPLEENEKISEQSNQPQMKWNIWAEFFQNMLVSKRDLEDTAWEIHVMDKYK